jgi:hypothetical protein
VSIALNNQLISSQDEGPDRLIGALRTWGVEYLLSVSAAQQYANNPEQRMPAIELVIQLAQCSYPRVRDACISLCILHPELADAVQAAYRNSEPAIAEQIAVLTLASIYLQRLWSFQLSIALGHIPNFPEKPFMSWWQQWNLPAPNCQHGRTGLAALEASEQHRRGIKLNFSADWQNQIDHLLTQELTKHHQLMVPITLLKLQEDDEQECSAMSMRPNVTKTDIDKFLKALGKTFRKPGRLYLAGGAALVHLGIRSGFTMDIDITIKTVEATDEDEMVMAIRRIVEQMQVNVEFASPGDFIPLPSQWMAQAKFVGRYGLVDVFYFDFSSLALSKISRGSDRDLIDVKLLLQQKLITWEGLDAAYNEIVPRMGKRPYFNVNPQRFAENYAMVRQMLK